MQKQTFLQTLGILAMSVFLPSSVALADSPDSEQAKVSCALDWQPSRASRKSTFYYAPKDSNSTNYYTVNISKETSSAQGVVRRLDYSFFINHETEDNAPQLTSTMRRDLTEYVFDTKIYGFHHTHLKAVGHEKLKRKVSSDTFANIRHMLPGERLVVEATQYANKSKKAYGKKWVEGNNDFTVEFLGCQNKVFAGQSFKTRTYSLKYDALNFSGNKNNAIRPQGRIITLDENTGIVLESISLNVDGTERSSGILTKIE